MSAPDRQQLSSAFGELVDAVRAAEQRLMNADPPLDDVELAEGYRWLFSILSVGLDTQVWADTDRPRFVEIVGPHRKWGGDNADAYYHHAPLDPDRTYLVRGRSGDSAYMSLTVYGGPDDGRYSERIVGQINHNDIDFADDGTFEVVLSGTPGPDPHPGNWVKLEPDAVCVITRDYLEDPVSGVRAEWAIEAVDPPATKVLTPAQVARGFRAATTWLTEQAQMCPLRVDPPNEVQEPYPVPKTTFGWAAGDAAYAMGSYRLDDDQALVIEGTSPDCTFWNLCLWNPFLHTYDYRYEQVTINDSQVTYESDGSWRLVVAAHDPGVPNWLHTQGHRHGLLWFRWFLPDATPERPRCRVVPLAELRTSDRLGPDDAKARHQDRVRLDDLDQPRFTPDAQAILDGLAAAGRNLAFDPDRLCQTTMDQTGLDQWGDTGFRERLDILCGALDAEARLSDYGKAATWEGLLQVLRNRLRIEDLIDRYPEIEDVPVARPIIICGQPRTGTTHLHNLLSADPALRHLPYWESLEPVLPQAEWPDPDDPRRGHHGGTADPRLARTQLAVDVVDLCMPLFKRMHEMTVDHTHEEIDLLAIDVAGMSFETTSLIRSWRDQYKATDQTPSYRYLRRVLQTLTWLRGGSRWVLKSPQHLEQFQPLLTTFPDATFVVTHRDPVAVTVSVCTMLAYAARMRTDRPDVPAITGYWVDRTADLLDACVTDHHLLPPDQTIDIRFDAFMADEMGTVEQIYSLAGQPLDDRARQAMADYVRTHPRGRHGTVDYEPETLGINPDEIRERLRPYATRFGVQGAS